MTFQRWQPPLKLTDADRQLLVRVSRAVRITNWDNHPRRDREQLDALVKSGLLTVERAFEYGLGWGDRYALTARGADMAEAEITARREAARQLRSCGSGQRIGSGG